MARPRKPTAHLELVGAFRKDPQRARDAEPQCEEEIMLPPCELSAEERICWDFLVRSAATVPGVLTALDSAYVALCAQALASTWYGDARSVNDRKAVGQMLGKLGFTPSDRSNVVVPKRDKPNPFAAYKQG